MCFTLPGIVISVILEQPEKARMPIALTLSGIVTDSNDEHPSNTIWGKSITPCGILIALNFE